MAGLFVSFECDVLPTSPDYPRMRYNIVLPWPPVLDMEAIKAIEETIEKDHRRLINVTVLYWRRME